MLLTYNELNGFTEFPKLIVASDGTSVPLLKVIDLFDDCSLIPVFDCKVREVVAVDQSIDDCAVVPKFNEKPLSTYQFA
jgi:hypothetical protein